MKKFILAITFTLLSACAEFSGMAYDPMLHMQEANALTSARQTLASCNSEPTARNMVIQLKRDVDIVFEYHSHINGNEQLNTVIEDTKEIVDSMYSRYNQGPVPTAYCTIKAELIVISINSMMNMTGRKQ